MISLQDKLMNLLKEMEDLLAYTTSIEYQMKSLKKRLEKNKLKLSKLL